MQGPNQMRSKTMTIMAAAVLFLPTIAHAEQAKSRGIYHRDELKNARDDVRTTRNGRDGSSSRNSSSAPPSSVVEVNAPREAHNAGWTFAVLTFRKYSHRS